MPNKELPLGRLEQNNRDMRFLNHWICTKAQQYGYDIKHLTRIDKVEEFYPSAEDRRRRAGGKKNPRVVDSSIGSAGSYRVRITYVHVSVNDLIQMVDLDIQDEDLQIPRIVRESLARLIADRRKSGEFFHQIASVATDLNKSKEHFLNILETVQRSLIPLYTLHNNASTISIQSARSAKSNRSARSIRSVGSRRSIKSVSSIKSLREESEAYIRKCALGVQLDPACNFNPESLVVYQLEEIPQNRLDFTMWCLWEDMVAARKHIQQIWVDYKDGKISLAVASTITNITATWIQKQEKESNKDDEPFRANFQYDKIINSFIPNGDVEHAKILEDPDFQAFTFPAITLLQFVRLYCYDDEKDFDDGRESRPVYTLNHLPRLSEEGFGGCEVAETYYRSLKREGRAVVSYEHAVLSKLILDYLLLYCHSRGYGWIYTGETALSKDALSEGFRVMLSTGKITMSTVFAARIVLDIHEIMEGYLFTCYEETCKVTTNILPTVDYSFSHLTEQYEDPDGFVWGDVEPQYVAATGMIARNWSNKHPGVVAKQMSPPPPEVIRMICIQEDPEFWLKNNPLATGWICASLMVDIEKCGVNLEEAYGSTFLMGWLYKAGRNSGLINSEWTDLEDFFTIAPDAFFKGTNPDCSFTLYRDFLITIGIAGGLSPENEENIIIPKFKTDPIYDELHQFHLADYYRSIDKGKEDQLNQGIKDGLHYQQHLEMLASIRPKSRSNVQPLIRHTRQAESEAEAQAKQVTAAEEAIMIKDSAAENVLLPFISNRGVSPEATAPGELSIKPQLDGLANHLTSTEKDVNKARLIPLVRSSVLLLRAIRTRLNSQFNNMFPVNMKKLKRENRSHESCADQKHSWAKMVAAILQGAAEQDAEGSSMGLFQQARQPQGRRLLEMACEIIVDALVDGVIVDGLIQGPTDAVGKSEKLKDRACGGGECGAM